MSIAKAVYELYLDSPDLRTLFSYIDKAAALSQNNAADVDNIKALGEGCLFGCFTQNTAPADSSAVSIGITIADIDTDRAVCLQTISFFGILLLHGDFTERHGDFTEREYDEWAGLTPEEKKRKLYEKQKALLDIHSGRSRCSEFLQSVSCCCRMRKLTE